ncbi:MAG TPA: hypothetical protein VGB42_05860 [Candidatus Thermoplasmatota archaeon]
MHLPRIEGREEPPWFLIIRPDARLWSFRLSGGMSTTTFIRTLVPPEEREPN